MRIIFMASAPIALPSLRRLSEAEGVDLCAVVTQPDRPKGRRQAMTPTPVKAKARELGLPVLTPDNVGAHESVAALTALAPGLIVVAAYGQYIPARVLGFPLHGAINLHPSLLPKYRGAAPVQMAIANGETETGVSIIDVAREMDTGDILLQEVVPINIDDTAETLEGRLAEVGAGLILEAVRRIEEGRVTRTPQRDADATMVYRLTKEDGRIDWHLPADIIRNRIRGFTPWPGTFCGMAPEGETILKVLWAEVVDGNGDPGTVLRLTGAGPVVATGGDALLLREVQPQGKKRMDGGAFLRGHPMKLGDRLY